MDVSHAKPIITLMPCDWLIIARMIYVSIYMKVSNSHSDILYTT